jgi:hypothetical protein
MARVLITGASSGIGRPRRRHPRQHGSSPPHRDLGVNRLLISCRYPAGRVDSTHPMRPSHLARELAGQNRSPL